LTEIQKKGIRQRIREAVTEDKINELLKEGESYEFARPATQGAWKGTADRRIQELRNPPKKKGKEEVKEEKP